MCKCIPTSSVWASFPGQTTVIQVKTGAVITTRLTIKLAENEGGRLEVTHQALHILYIWGALSCSFPLLTFFYNFYFFLPVLLSCTIVCLSLPQLLSLTTWFLVPFYQSCHPLLSVPPSVPSLRLFDILSSCRLALSLSYSSVILPCCCHLSCTRSLSPCPTSSFFIISLSLKHSIDGSGGALWPLPKKKKKVNYMLGIGFFYSDDLLETLLYLQSVPITVHLFWATAEKSLMRKWQASVRVHISLHIDYLPAIRRGSVCIINVKTGALPQLHEMLLNAGVISTVIR